MARVNTWLGRSVAACVTALLLVVLLVVDVAADSYDTEAAALGATVYVPMADTSTAFAETIAANSCAWHSALASSTDAPGSATHSGNFTNYSYCEFSSSIAIGSSLSFAAWIKPNSGSIPDNMPLAYLCTSSSSCSGAGHVDEVWVDVANKLCIRSDAVSGCGPTHSGAGSFTDTTQWHMWAVTISGTTANFYYDGTADGSAVTLSAGFTAFSSANGLVGASWVNGDYLTALVSRWALFNGTALSSGNVATLYGFSAGAGPASTLNMTPYTQYASTGKATSWNVQATDSLGNPTSATISSVSTIPGGGLSGCTQSGTTETCTAGPIGSYLVTFTAASGASESFMPLLVVGSTSRFELASNGSGVAVGVTFTVWDVAFDSAGTNISAADSWTLTVPSGASCGTGYNTGTQFAYDCHLTSAGSVAFLGTDQYGYQATVTVTEAAAPAASTVSCNTGNFASDAVCWLQQVVSTIITLPGQMARQVVDFLFVSQTGKSYVDFSAVLSSLLPGVSCRSGQAPTHPDGVHCLPFPLSTPFDVYNIASFIFGVSPVAPSLTFTVHAAPLSAWSATVDPAFMLSSSLMDKIRGVEYVVFLVALGWATGEALKLFGVGS